MIEEIETVWNTTTTPKTSASFDVVAGDLLVVVGHKRDGASFLNTPTNTGTAFTWTLQQSVEIGTTEHKLYIWTAPATVTQSMTVSVTQSAANDGWGFSKFTFRYSGGVGASVKTSSLGSGAPSIDITTTRPGSAVIVFNSDNAAVDGASRTWRANAGTLTETTYFRVAAQEGLYIGYHADAGVIGTYAVGLTAPTGQSYHMIALEILALHTKRPEGGMVSLSGGLSV